MEPLNRQREPNAHRAGGVASQNGEQHRPVDDDQQPMDPGDQRMKTDETIVVGGGIAGLMCAAKLANAGRRVTVLEASAALGGRAATYEEQGYRLNFGGHALYWPDEKRLRAVGVRISGGHLRADRGSVLWRGELSAWPLPPRVGRSALGVTERAALLRVLAGVLTRHPERLTDQSAADWIDAHSRTPGVAGMLGALLRLSSYGARLDAMPAEIAVGMVRAAAVRPVRYLDGGWVSIVDGLAARVRAGGGRIETSTRVTGLLGEEQVRGVCIADGTERLAGSVVLAGLSPTRTDRLLANVGGALPPTATVTGGRVTAACLDVALRRLPAGAISFALGLDEPLYLSTHSRYATLAPGEGAVVHLMRYDDGQPQSDTEMRGHLERLFDLAQPGWRDELIHARFAPRMIVDHLLPVPGAGLASRPDITDAGVAGVILAGDWVGPAGWLVGSSLASGAAAADAVLAAATTARRRGSPTATITQAA
ncbi:phytoene desaturase family protein [Conexibacter sp. DBS9H8]|uniref:phytoene desaturase family protein n=1 Tax=Conexibacter sp. DBS9H8 TaxID=2937801 RepID=UPI0035316879